MPVMRCYHDDASNGIFPENTFTTDDPEAFRQHLFDYHKIVTNLDVRSKDVVQKFRDAKRRAIAFGFPCPRSDCAAKPGEGCLIGAKRTYDDIHVVRINLAVKEGELYPSALHMKAVK